MEGETAAKQGPPKNHSTKKGTQSPCDPDWGMMKQWTFGNRGPLLILRKEASMTFDANKNTYFGGKTCLENSPAC